MEREFHLVRALKHKNVLRVFEFEENADAVCLISEFCGRGTLLDVRQDLDLMRVQQIWLQLLEGVTFIHSHGSLVGYVLSFFVFFDRDCAPRHEASEYFL